MDLRALAETVMGAYEAGDFETIAAHMTDDFQASGADLQQSMNGAQWLGLARVLRAAFPDLSYNFQIEGIEGSVVKTSSQLTGTHTGDLDLSAMGMGVIPATGKSVSADRQTSEGVVEGDRLKSLYFHSAPGGGLQGILMQLGVQPPG